MGRRYGVSVRVRLITLVAAARTHTPNLFYLAARVGDWVRVMGEDYGSWLCVKARVRVWVVVRVRVMGECCGGGCPHAHPEPLLLSS